MACKSWRYEVFETDPEEISQEEILNGCFFVSPHLQGLQLQKFIYEIRTSGNVRFLPSAPHSKTSVNVHNYHGSR